MAGEALRSPAGRNSFVSRIARAALGDPLLYEELALDPAAIRQSMFVVLLMAGSFGVGNVLASLYADETSGPLAEFISPATWALLGWVLSALFTYLIVSAVTGTSAPGFMGGTFLQFIRSVGFTSSPGLMMLLSPIPLVGSAAFFAATIWMTIAMVIAVKNTLACGSALAIISVVLGSIIGRAVALVIVASAFA